MIDVVGLITARGGSKGIPRKNVKLLAGKPLIAWTIEAALKSGKLSRIIVSTDDDEIIQVAQAWGAETPFVRPTEVSQDNSPHILAVEHAIHWLEEHEHTRPEYILLLQPTSPLRMAEDINAAIEIAAGNQAEAVVSISETKHHPYLTKHILPNGLLADFVSTDLSYLRRQDLPPAYAINGAIYLNRSDSLLNARTFLPPNTYGYVMPLERSLDIDSPWDFYLTELILNHKNEFRHV